MRPYLLPLLVLGLALLAGCANRNQFVLDSGSQSQVQLRSIQSRVYDTTDQEGALRTIIATLQDLGFVIEKADNQLGTVSGTKLDRYDLRMTVSVRPKNEQQLLVRANAQYNIYPVNDPEPYQKFFDALSKAMFLTAHLDED